jgi:hypothetical protein
MTNPAPDIRTALVRLTEVAEATADSFSVGLMNEAIDEATAALDAEPSENVPIPNHASMLAFACGREPWATWLKSGGSLESAHLELSDLMLAVLARWGQSTPPAPEAPVKDSPVANALLQAEAALADVAEGEIGRLCSATEKVTWAELRCTEALAAIRPVMKEHGIRTSEWPAAVPAPAPATLLQQQCAPPAPEPMEVGELLTNNGVFKGSHGIEGLLSADAFWEQQPYGTRLYYGDGIADYLHRGVLRSVVTLLQQQEAELAALKVYPEGEGPSGKQLYDLWDKVAEYFALYGEAVSFACAVLARWSRTTPLPAPMSEEMQGLVIDLNEVSSILGTR